MFTLIDLGVLVAYFALMIAIGFISRARIKQTEDYVLAGRKLGYVMTVGTLAATMIGGSATMGKAGMAYNYGIAFLWTGVAIALGYVFITLITGNLRRSGLWYIPEVIEKRYGRGTRVFTAVIMLLAVVAIYGAQLIAMGIVFNQIGNPLGISYATSVIIAGAVVVIYTFIGGLIAVARTDLIQMLIMVPLVGFILPGIVFTQGVSLADLTAQLKPNMWDFWGGLPLVFLVSILLTYTPGVIIDSTIWQRAMSARDEKVARWSPIASGIIYIYWSLIVVLLGMAAVILLPNLATAAARDAVIPTLMVKYLPIGLVGLGVTALLAVMMSTASGCMLMSGIFLTKDILPAIARKPLSPSAELRASMISTLAIGLLGILFALTFSGIFSIMMIAYGLFVSGLFFPIILALYWKKATRIGAISSIAVSFVLYVALVFGPKPFGLEPILLALLVSLVVMVVVSLLTYRPDTATAPIFAEEAGGGEGAYGMR